MSNYQTELTYRLAEVLREQLQEPPPVKAEANPYYFLALVVMRAIGDYDLEYSAKHSFPDEMQIVADERLIIALDRRLNACEGVIRVLTERLHGRYIENDEAFEMLIELDYTKLWATAVLEAIGDSTLYDSWTNFQQERSWMKWVEYVRLKEFKWNTSTDNLDIE
jgi:hypothetical protein